MAIDFSRFNRQSAERSLNTQRTIQSSGGGNGILDLSKAPYPIEYWDPKEYAKGGPATLYIDIIASEVTNPQNPAVLSGAIKLGEGDYGLELAAHLTPAGEDNKSHACLKNWGKKCPRCEAFFATWQRGVQDSGDKAHSASNRLYMIVVPRKDRNTPGDKAYIWNAPIAKKGGFDILGESRAEMPPVFFWWPTEDGRTVQFEVTMDGKFPVYNRIRFLPRSPETGEALYKKFGFSLDSLLVIPTASEMEADIYSAPREDADEGRQETRPDARESRAAQDAYHREETRESRPQTRQEAPQEPSRDPAYGKPFGEESPAAQEPKQARSTAKECPNGLTFGRDWETKPVCQGCPVYDACEKAG